MMKQKIKISLILTLLIVNVTLAQSPWTKEKGKAYVQLGFSGIFYNQAQLDGKKIDLSADYKDITIQVYGEFGITNKLEAQLIVPYKSVSRGNLVGISSSYSALGNITVGLKYKVFDKDWKISTGLQFSPKTSQYDDNSGLSSGFNASTILPYFTIGKSSGKWYYFGNLGYGYMNNNYSDYFKLGAEVGYKVVPKGHIIFVLDTRNIISKESAFDNDKHQWISYLDRQTYNAIGLKLNYEFINDKFGANFAGFGAFGNDNAPLAPSLNFGIYTKF